LILEYLALSRGFVVLLLGRPEVIALFACKRRFCVLLRFAAFDSIRLLSLYSWFFFVAAAFRQVHVSLAFNHLKLDFSSSTPHTFPGRFCTGSIGGGSLSTTMLAQLTGTDELGIGQRGTRKSVFCSISSGELHEGAKLRVFYSLLCLCSLTEGHN
jgi:hypothetical protein